MLPWPDGCAFAPRCARRIDECVGEPPELVLTHDARSYRCVNPVPIPGLTPEADVRATAPTTAEPGTVPAQAEPADPPAVPGFGPAPREEETP